MGRFSSGDAIKSGFRLIRREPAAIGIWALLYLLIGLAPTLLLQMSVASHRPPAGAGEVRVVLANMSRMAMWMPLIWGLSLLYMSVTYAGACRAILQPEDRRYFYLRLGRRELSVGLTALAILLLFAFAIVAAVAVVSVLGQHAPGLVTFLTGCALVAVTIWLGLRVSLAAPLAFARQRFGLAEAWTMTAGLGWKLFGVLAALVGIVLGLEIIILVPIGIGLGMSGALKAFVASQEAGEAFSDPPAVIAAYVVILPILATLLYAILYAPWINIYQQLAETSDAEGS